jgi:hypothetical protein
LMAQNCEACLFHFSAEMFSVLMELIKEFMPVYMVQNVENFQ